MAGIIRNRKEVGGLSQVIVINVGINETRVAILENGLASWRLSADEERSWGIFTAQVEMFCLVWKRRLWILG